MAHVITLGIFCPLHVHVQAHREDTRTHKASSRVLDSMLLLIRAAKRPNVHCTMASLLCG